MALGSSEDILQKSQQECDLHVKQARLFCFLSVVLPTGEAGDGVMQRPAGHPHGPEPTCHSQGPYVYVSCVGQTGSSRRI